MSEFVDLSEKVHRELVFLHEKTGIGAHTILRAPRDQRPTGLTARVVRQMLDGTVFKVRKTHLDFVLNRWRTAWRSGDYPALIPPGFSELLKAERDRTGIGAKALLANAANPPEHLSAAAIGSWITSPPLRANKAHMDWELTAWGTLPDAETRSAESPAKPKARKVRQRRSGKPKPRRVGKSVTRPDNKAQNRTAIDLKTLREIRRLRDATGIGAGKLLRDAEGMPEGLTPSVVNNWLSGMTKTAVPEHLTFVRSAWEKHAQYEYVTLSTGDVARLEELLRDTGIGPRRLLRGCRGSQPEGLMSSMIQTWLSDTERPVRRDHFDFVVERLMAAKHEGWKRIRLTEKHLSALEIERSRTGVEVAELMRGLDDREDIPKATTVYSWLSEATREASESEYRAILGAWRDLPNLALPEPEMLGVDRFEVEHGRIVLNKPILATLRDLQQSTGHGAVALLRGAKAEGLRLPDGLSSRVILQWLQGAAKTARPEHLEFAIRLWRGCEGQKSPAIHLSSAQRSELERYRQAGYLPSQVFNAAEEKPSDLTPAMVSGWLSGRTSKVRHSHWQWLVSACEDLSRAQDRRVPVTPEIIAELSRLRDASGVAQTNLLRRAQHVPDGLTASMISAWINGSSATARKDWLDWVVSRWEALARTPEL